MYDDELDPDGWMQEQLERRHAELERREKEGRGVPGWSPPLDPPASQERRFHPHGPDGGLGRPDARDAVDDDEGAW